MRSHCKCGVPLSVDNTYKGIRSKCKPCHIKSTVDYKRNNPHIAKKCQENYYKTAHGKARLKEYQKKTAHKIREASLRSYYKTIKPNFHKDTFKKLLKYLRNRTRAVLKYKDFDKKKHLVEYLGCNGFQLQDHLESKFKQGMTWGNYGKWHIDHIIPLSSAKTVEELYQLCHYTNLQPLWAHENLSKGDR